MPGPTAPGVPGRTAGRSDRQPLACPRRERREAPGRAAVPDRPAERSPRPSVRGDRTNGTGAVTSGTTLSAALHGDTASATCGSCGSCGSRGRSASRRAPASSRKAGVPNCSGSSGPGRSASTCVSPAAGPRSSRHRGTGNSSAGAGTSRRRRIRLPGHGVGLVPRSVRARAPAGGDRRRPAALPAARAERLPALRRPAVHPAGARLERTGRIPGPPLLGPPAPRHPRTGLTDPLDDREVVR